jgi:hypothetical protein
MRSAMAGSDSGAMRFCFAAENAAKAQHFVKDTLCDFGLAELRQRQVAAIARKQGDNICVVVEAGAFGGYVVRDDEIGILRCEFFAGVFRDVVRFGRESNNKAVAFGLRGFGQNIRRWFKTKR